MAHVATQVTFVLLQWLLHKSLVVSMAFHVRLQAPRRRGDKVTQFALQRLFLFMISAVIAYVYVALCGVVASFAFVDFSMT